MKMKGSQGLHVTKIVPVWTVTGTMQLLKGCLAVKNRIGVINQFLINLICVVFLMLSFMRYLVGFFRPRLAPVSRQVALQ